MQSVQTSVSNNISNKKSITSILHTLQTMVFEHDKIHTQIATTHSEKQEKIGKFPENRKKDELDTLPATKATHGVKPKWPLQRDGFIEEYIW